MTIKEYLKAHGLTVREFAEAVGCSPQTLSYTANGRRTPSFSLMEEIQRAANGEVNFEGIAAPFRTQPLEVAE